MGVKNKKLNRRLKIKMRVRKSVNGTADRPRMTVFRSNKQIYVQLKHLLLLIPVIKVLREPVTKLNKLKKSVPLLLKEQKLPALKA